MGNLILQRLVPAITAFVVFINSVGGLFGNSAVIPYNPERTDVVVSGEVITDIEKVLDCYNEAVENTGFVLGSAKTFMAETPVLEMPLDEELKSLIVTLFESMNITSSTIFEIPYEGNITVADVRDAKMSVDGDKTSIIINIKDYSHGITDENSSNPITNAFGFSTDVKASFDELGMAPEEVYFEYTDCVISCIVDDGKIIYGDWDYICSAEINDLSMTFRDTDIRIDKMRLVMESNTDI